MPDKTIVTNVTIHVPDAGHEPFKIDPGSGAHLAGTYKVKTHGPGIPVRMEASEADRVIARFGGSVVEEHPDEPKAPPTGEAGAKAAEDSAGALGNTKVTPVGGARVEAGGRTEAPGRHGKPG